MSLLVRREHSRMELLGKLTRRGFDAAACEEVLDALVEENALSDERFAEHYDEYRERARQGRFLSQRGFTAAQISAALGTLFDD